MPYNSVPVDTSHLPYCFSRLPVRIHRDKEEIQRFTLELVHATKTEGSKAHKHALYRHAVTGPDMNVYALSWCEADLDKMKLLIEFIELIWAHDDVTEEDSLDDAVAECEQLRRAMYEEYDNEPTADNGFGLRIKRFRDIRNRMKAVDSVGWIEIQDAMEEWLPIDTKLKEWDSLEEYLDLRKVHVGNNVMTAFIRWAMGIHLTKDELVFIKDYTDAVGVWLGLMNDYMSWKRERTQPTDRVMNSVYLLMKKYNLPEDSSVDMVRGILVKQEGKVLEMSEDLHGQAGLSTGMRAYIDNLEYYAGATFYWSLLAPRYAKPQSFDPARTD
nr:terpenoid synthase [Candolleomyces candolleanus]